MQQDEITCSAAARRTLSAFGLISSILDDMINDRVQRGVLVRGGGRSLSRTSLVAEYQIMNHHLDLDLTHSPTSSLMSLDAIPTATAPGWRVSVTQWSPKIPVSPRIYLPLIRLQAKQHEKSPQRRRTIVFASSDDHVSQHHARSSTLS